MEGESMKGVEFKLERSAGYTPERPAVVFRVFIGGRFVWYTRFSMNTLRHWPTGRRAGVERLLKNLRPQDAPWEPNAEEVTKGVDREALYQAAVTWLEAQGDEEAKTNEAS